MPGTLTIKEVNRLDRGDFVDRVGRVFEGSSWVAERAFERGPFSDLAGLRDALVSEVYRADEGERVALIQAHPDLAGKAAVAGELTPESAGEQSSADLDRLSPGEYEEFTRLNREYRERFGLPMVVCVREHDKHSILRLARERLRNTREEELDLALAEVAKIATLRLYDLVRDDTSGEPERERSGD